MPDKKIKINRAPVLTLWATVVAEQLGYDKETALTLGKAVAGLNAQSKGQSLGIYKKKSAEEKEKEAQKQNPVNVEFVELMGRGIPLMKTSQGFRAVVKNDQVDPQNVEKYLRQKFGDDLDDTRAAMEKLAKAFTPKQLEVRAYGLYERFRPKIPEGAKGWGVKGEMDLKYIQSLVK